MNQATLHGVLGRWFPMRHLDMIECAFECNAGHNSREAARKFGREYVEDHDRLVAIMQNIVQNKGTFMPGLDGKND